MQHAGMFWATACTTKFTRCALEAGGKWSSSTYQWCSTAAYLCARPSRRLRFHCIYDWRMYEKDYDWTDSCYPRRDQNMMCFCSCCVWPEICRVKWPSCRSISAVVKIQANILNRTNSANKLDNGPIQDSWQQYLEVSQQLLNLQVIIAAEQTPGDSWL